MRPDPLDAAAPAAREAEAARLLSKLLECVDLVTHRAARARIYFEVDQETFDRLCVWRAASENDEPEPLEDDGEGEREEHW